MELNRFSGDPTYQPLITMAKYLRTAQEEGMRQATDSWRIFARENAWNTVPNIYEKKQEFKL
jgi:hypothetical protein